MKIAVFGASEVGKTRSLARWLGFVPISPTLGMQAHSTRLDGESLLIYDTSGRSCFDSLLYPLLDSLDGAVFMYRLDDRSSFADALIWLTRFQSRPRPAALIGVPGSGRVVGCIDVQLAVQPWVRRGVPVWFDELESGTLRTACRFLIKHLRKRSILGPPISTQNVRRPRISPRPQDQDLSQAASSDAAHS